MGETEGRYDFAKCMGLVDPHGQCCGYEADRLHVSSGDFWARGLGLECSIGRRCVLADALSPSDCLSFSLALSPSFSSDFQPVSMQINCQTKY